MRLGIRSRTTLVGSVSPLTNPSGSTTLRFELFFSQRPLRQSISSTVSESGNGRLGLGPTRYLFRLLNKHPDYSYLDLLANIQDQSVRYIADSPKNRQGSSEVVTMHIAHPLRPSYPTESAACYRKSLEEVAKDLKAQKHRGIVKDPRAPPALESGGFWVIKSFLAFLSPTLPSHVEIFGRFSRFVNY